MKYIKRALETSMDIVQHDIVVPGFAMSVNFEIFKSIASLQYGIMCTCLRGYLDYKHTPLPFNA